MSATRLLVLGVVRVHGQAHGYRVGRELMDWGAEEWANVKWGSIYHALRKLSEQGKLREFVAEGEVTERTSYEITDEGEADFLRLLRGALSHGGDDHALLCAGVTLMPCLPRAEVIELLKERLAVLEKSDAEVVSAIDATEAEWGKPAHVRELFRLWHYTVDAGADWTRQLIASLETGEYVMADDSPQAFGLPPV
ncbi:MAG: PadR family transcriptional regulator [Nocardiopsis sp. BM-2018]|uniref:PadR family transcriptional regulator n=1 Tax=Nocardiopsis valliformis TaxID=239974 RepID=UPI0003792121|nr:PadR family transcriptional regulator [Nocardiopsis valliformis]QRN80936.1 MAG: PadR family transcriptional regulator [Nocardiopsis sp. BM-2018]